MNTTEITTALSWIDTNIEAAPMLLKASLLNIKTQIEKAPATFALNAKKTAIRQQVVESRNAMKALETELKAEQEARKAEREVKKAEKLVADAKKEEARRAKEAAQAEAAKKSEERIAAAAAKKAEAAAKKAETPKVVPQAD